MSLHSLSHHSHVNSWKFLTLNFLRGALHFERVTKCQWENTQNYCHSHLRVASQFFVFLVDPPVSHIVPMLFRGLY